MAVFLSFSLNQFSGMPLCPCENPNRHDLLSLLLIHSLLFVAALFVFDSVSHYIIGE